ncbi:MAG TPA: hypothetical protein VIO64_19320 [Pseudobacteroides sp.]|uniref:hypothetical protein n=1 Tax=Pseudobacteroides sp. TaxID=1968840 RepID=UPI002F92D87A
MSTNVLLREHALETVNAMLMDKLISAQDLRKFIPQEINTTEPEYLRQEMESWYRTLGIEELIKEKFSLKLPYFTRQEIQEAYENNEIILCVPKGISRKQLGMLFNLSSWALEDELVGQTTEIEDFWFKAKNTLTPEHTDKPGNEIKRIYEKEGKLGMSLERYMAFVARMRYLHGQTPDLKLKTWITHGRYEGKAMLVAGFDSKSKFSVHGWMPNFHTPQVGGRYVIIPDHLYI